MRSVSNQPARLYGTAKSHEFYNINTTSTCIKFQTIIDQTGFVISYYLSTLCKTYIPSLIPNISLNI